MSNYSLILLFLFVQITTAQTIDVEKSKVSFKVNNMNVRTVEGEFTTLNGKIAFNKSNLSNAYFNVCIATESLKTDRKKRDENLKNEIFFDTKNYPTICFESNSIMKIFGDYIVEGKLTMLGVTKTIKIPLSYSNNTFIGSFEINRQDFNLGKNISSFIIDNNVSITINCKLKNNKLALNNPN